MKKKPNWLVIIGLSLAGLCLLGCVTSVALILSFPSLYQAYMQHSSLAVGASAPDFELTGLTGETVRLSQFHGQPVLLNFSTSWCPPCREEVPLLEEVYKTHPGLIVLLVDSKESAAIVQTFAEELGMSHPVLLDLDGKVLSQYEIAAFPTSLFIDKDGIIRAKHVAKITPEVLAEYLPLIGVNP